MNEIDWNIYAEKNYYNDEKLKKQIEDYSAFLKFKKINNFNKFDALEFGAGQGINTILFSNLFSKLLSTEPNDTLYSMLSKKIEEDDIKKNVKIQQTDLESFKINRKFDIIVLANVFLFIKDKKKALLKFSNLLKKKKYLLISEPFIFFSYKHNNQKLLQESVIAINNTKKFEIIYIGLVGLDKWIYLLKLK